MTSGRSKPYRVEVVKCGRMAVFHLELVALEKQLGRDQGEQWRHSEVSHYSRRAFELCKGRGRR